MDNYCLILHNLEEQLTYSDNFYKNLCYTSCIKLHSKPILPPLLNEKRRKDVSEYRHKMISIEKKLHQNQALQVLDKIHLLIDQSKPVLDKSFVSAENYHANHNEKINGMLWQAIISKSLPDNGLINQNAPSVNIPDNLDNSFHSAPLISYPKKISCPDFAKCSRQSTPIESTDINTYNNETVNSYLLVRSESYTLDQPSTHLLPQFKTVKIQQNPHSSILAEETDGHKQTTVNGCNGLPNSVLPPQKILIRTSSPIHSYTSSSSGGGKQTQVNTCTKPQKEKTFPSQSINFTNNCNVSTNFNNVPFTQSTKAGCELQSNILVSPSTNPVLINYNSNVQQQAKIMSTSDILTENMGKLEHMAKYLSSCLRREKETIDEDQSVVTLSFSSESDERPLARDNRMVMSQNYCFHNGSFSPHHDSEDTNTTPRKNLNDSSKTNSVTRKENSIGELNLCSPIQHVMKNGVENGSSSHTFSFASFPDLSPTNCDKDGYNPNSFTIINEPICLNTNNFVNAEKKHTKVTSTPQTDFYNPESKNANYRHDFNSSPSNQNNYLTQNECHNLTDNVIDISDASNSKSFQSREEEIVPALRNRKNSLLRLKRQNTCTNAHTINTKTYSNNGSMRHQYASSTISSSHNGGSPCCESVNNYTNNNFYVDFKDTTLAALIKGYLVRRLMKTSKLQHLRTTIKDTVECLNDINAEKMRKNQNISNQTASLNNKNVEHRNDNLSSSPEETIEYLLDQDLEERLTAQLACALDEWHEIFFGYDSARRMKIIEHDRNVQMLKLERKQDEEKRKLAIKKQLLEATQNGHQHLTKGAIGGGVCWKPNSHTFSRNLSMQRCLGSMRRNLTSTSLSSTPIISLQKTYPLNNSSYNRKVPNATNSQARGKNGETPQNNITPSTRSNGNTSKNNGLLVDSMATKVDDYTLMKRRHNTLPRKYKLPTLVLKNVSSNNNNTTYSPNINEYVYAKPSSKTFNMASGLKNGYKQKNTILVNL